MADLVEKLTVDPSKFAQNFYRKEGNELLSPYLSNQKPEIDTDNVNEVDVIQRIAERFEIRYFPVNSNDPSVEAVTGPKVFNQLRMDPFTNNFVLIKLLSEKYPILPLLDASVTTEILEVPGYETPLLTVSTYEVYPAVVTTLDRLKVEALTPYREIRTFREPKLIFPDQDQDNSPLVYRNTAALNEEEDETGTLDNEVIIYSQEVMKVSFIDNLMGQVYSAIKNLQFEGFSHWYLTPGNIVLKWDGKIAITNLYWAAITKDLSTGPTRLYSGYGIDFTFPKFIYSTDFQTFRFPDNWSFARYQSFLRAGQVPPPTLDWYVFLLSFLQLQEIYPVFFSSEKLVRKYWTYWWDPRQEREIKYRLYRQIERNQVVDISTTLGMLLGATLKSNFPVE